MTTDIAALKAAALACDPSKCADEAEHERRLGEFYSECEPEDVLGLIAENERLRGLLAPVADGIQQKRQRWLDNIAAAIRVGLPKSLRQDLDRTYAEIQSSIQHGGGRNLLAEIERLQAVKLAVLSEPSEGAYIGPRNAPGHCHTVPGVWDRGNSGRAGKECGWCKAWNLVQALVKEEAGDAGH